MKKLLYLSILILAACTKPANNITAPASIVMTYPQSLDSLGLVADKWYSLGDTSKAILFASDMTVKQVHTVNSKKDTAIFYCPFRGDYYYPPQPIEISKVRNWWVVLGDQKRRKNKQIMLRNLREQQS